MLSYVEIFVDYLLGLYQGPVRQRCHMLSNLLRSLHKFFLTLESSNEPQRKELFSFKNLDAGYCTYSTCKVRLGWVIYMFIMNLSLPSTKRHNSRRSCSPLLSLKIGLKSTSGTRSWESCAPWNTPSPETVYYSFRFRSP